MKVLVACEFSGVVRDAFIARGHNAISCDLLATEKDGPHITGDVKHLLKQNWDLIIAHPPCTYLCNSGVRWLYGGKGTVIDNHRWNKMLEACDFFNQFKICAARVAIENPIPHGFALERIGRYSQRIQPYEYGHGETKSTCLWLKNLPLLVGTNLVNERKPRVHFASPGPDRWKERSRTLSGIASAMAEQWG